MNKEFIPYEQALALKELGFDEPCLGFYNKEDRPNLGYCTNSFQDDTTLEIKCTAPLYQQAFRWFREKHKLWAYNIPYNTGKYCIEIWRLVEGDDYVKTKEDRVIMDNWEEAELACLNKIIELIKTK